VNQLDLSVAGGLIYQGICSDRPDDVVGLGITHARNGSPFLQARRDAGIQTERAETVVELTYRAELGGILVFQPDIQWVRNPGMDPAVGDALLLGLRAYLLLAFPGQGTDS
jgi:porin